MTRLLRLAVTAAALILIAGVALAHRDATGIVKQRMDAMTAMGDAMKSLRAMMRGTQAYEAERVTAYAGAIAGRAGDKMMALFPEGSLKHPTRAKPAIWADWNGFAELAHQLGEAADALAATASHERAYAGSGRASRGSAAGAGTQPGSGPQDFTAMAPDAVFERLQRTCSDCHRAFRTKK